MKSHLAILAILFVTSAVASPTSLLSAAEVLATTTDRTDMSSALSFAAGEGTLPSFQTMTVFAPPNAAFKTRRLTVDDLRRQLLAFRLDQLESLPVRSTIPTMLPDESLSVTGETPFSLNGISIAPLYHDNRVVIYGVDDFFEEVNASSCRCGGGSLFAGVVLKQTLLPSYETARSAWGGIYANIFLITVGVIVVCVDVTALLAKPELSLLGAVISLIGGLLSAASGAVKRSWFRFGGGMLIAVCALTLVIWGHHLWVTIIIIMAELANLTVHSVDLIKRWL